MTFVASPSPLALAQRTQRVVRQNLALSIVVIGTLAVGAVAGVFSLPWRSWFTRSAVRRHRQRAQVAAPRAKGRRREGNACPSRRAFIRPPTTSSGSTHRTDPVPTREEEAMKIGMKKTLSMSFDDALDKVPEALKSEGFWRTHGDRRSEDARSEAAGLLSKYRILGACNRRLPTARAVGRDRRRCDAPVQRHHLRAG